MVLLAALTDRVSIPLEVMSSLRQPKAWYANEAE